MASVLIVEDETLLRHILTLNLARHGYTVAEADSVDSAIEALTAFSRPFDVILLDINLPDNTGWDVLRYLRQREEGVATMERRSRVVIMTAVRPAQRRLDEFHPDAVLLKPFPIDALLRLIERNLRMTAAG
jgi:CheY-like chemotaxis protein